VPRKGHSAFSPETLNELSSESGRCNSACP